MQEGSLVDTTTTAGWGSWLPSPHIVVVLAASTRLAFRYLRKTPEFTWKQFLPKHAPRADALLALSIPVGCAAVLLEAYFRSNENDADDAITCAYAPTLELIQPHHIRTLERNGIVVIPNAISAKQTRHAQGDVERLIKSSQGELHKTSNDEDVRQDVVAWIGENILLGSIHTDKKQDTTKLQGDSNMETEDDLEHRPHLLHCVRLLRGIAHALAQQGYSKNSSLDSVKPSPPEAVHSRNDNATTHNNDNNHIRVPRQCQLACYQGNDHAGYSRHLDQCKSPLQELGLLEWLRLSDYRSRSITTILYLNEPDRPTSAGGALRCWVEKKVADEDRVDRGEQKDTTMFHEPFDISPKGGTLVIFQSDRVEHEVLSSTQDRYALTNWISSS